MDRRVTIQRKTTTSGPTGQPIETWPAWKTVWGGKRDVRADERFRADQELATKTTVWMTHYIPGLRTDDRLSVDGEVYDIIGIAELGRRSGLEITATVVQA